MTLHELALLPRSGFGTPLAGDTLFGHLCWQLALDDGLAGPLDRLLADYAEKPFAVLSSAVPRLDGAGGPRWALPRPHLPLGNLFPVETAGDAADAVRRRKDLKARRWMLVGPSFLADGFGAADFVTDEELAGIHTGDGVRRGRYTATVGRTRNSINRLTSTTGGGSFAPYWSPEMHYAPGAVLSVFVAIDSGRISPDVIREAFTRIGLTGYGRDASVGRGRFEVAGLAKVSTGSPAGCDACYTLGPCVPGSTTWDRVFFAPCVRFGRHGATLAKSEHPFKAPVVMAAEGSVFARSGGMPGSPWIGIAVTGVSKAAPETVVQGYAPYLPFRFGGGR